MAHLRSYKSFNLEEIEEIESRIFCPPNSNENTLKGCPGSTNIPNTLYESTLGTLYKREFGSHNDVTSWEDIKNNIISVLHLGEKVAPMVVHMNDHYLSHDDLDFYDDISVCGVMDGQEMKEISWSRNVPENKVLNVATNIKNCDVEPEPIFETESNCTALCWRILDICFCRKRKK